ncbi:MAG: hypothetical protein ACI9DK_003082 [Vicingaceae bacterium]
MYLNSLILSSMLLGILLYLKWLLIFELALKGIILNINLAYGELINDILELQIGKNINVSYSYYQL